MSRRDDVAAFWDNEVASFFKGGKPHLENADLRVWYTAYSGDDEGAVTADAFPEPYIGPLASRHGQPRLVALGLNLGNADLDFQGRGGGFERKIRECGSYGDWAMTEPYLSEPWRSAEHLHNRYHERLRLFAQRWTNDATVTSRDVLVLELFPWHSKRITAPIRPEPRLVERYIWQPLADLEVSVIFAFGKDWVAVAKRLRLHEESVHVAFSTSTRRLRVFALPGGQRLAVMWQSGYSGPPNSHDTELLRVEFGVHSSSSAR